MNLERIAGVRRPMKKLRLIPAILAVLAIPAGALAAAGPSGYAVGDSLKPGGEGGWDYLTLDPAAHRLYLPRSTHVQVLDLKTNTVVGDVANTPGVHGVAVAPPVGEGYTSNGRDSSVTVFDLKTFQPIAKIHLDARGPDAILYDPYSERVFTFNGGSSNATALDIRTHRVVGTVALGGRPEFAVSDSSGKIYVNLEDKNAIVQFDAKSLAVLNVWPVDPGEGPTGLALDRQHRRLFCGCGNRHLIVLDADSGKRVADLPIGSGVDATAFDPARQLAFSSNGTDGTLTVIREETPQKFTVLENVPTRRGARTMALDPTTHRIYLATASFGPPPPATTERPHPRPSIVPNSFVLLIASP
jgi:DNA-binding beta-propeller fold protein YncE